MKIRKYIKFIFWGYWRIPKGKYCYKLLKVVYPEDKTQPPTLKTRHCPYWDKIEDLPSQADGYCHWLERGDYDFNNDETKEFVDIDTGVVIPAPEMPFGVGLLWDACKECNIKDDPDWMYDDSSLRFKIYNYFQKR